MVDRFSPSAQRILSSSLAFAREFGHSYIGSEHILLAMLSDKGSSVSRILTSHGAKEEKTRRQITDCVGKGERSADCVSDMTPVTRDIIAESAKIAEKEGSGEVTDIILLFALIRAKNSTAVKLLSAQGCKVNELSRELELKVRSDSAEHSSVQSKRVPKAEERLPNLEKFARNLTAEAEKSPFDPVIGRESETERIMRILIRRTKNNPCLIGEPGVGKTAIIEGLAQMIADGNVPDELADLQIFSLDLPSMLAGAKYRGDFEERMKLVIDEVSKRPNIVLFIDELHTIIGAGSAEGAIDAANIIKPALARGKIKLIGATTLDEYRKHIEKDSAFERRFQSINISEPSIEESIRILYGIRDKYESHHNIKISDAAIEEAVKLSARYITDRFLPDKAIDLIDESLARVKIESVKAQSEESNRKRILRLAFCERGGHSDKGASTIMLDKISCENDYTGTVNADDIVRTLSEWTGIPLSVLGKERENKSLTLEDAIKNRVFGQDDAIKRVANVIGRSKTCVRDPSRPIATFLFTGSTGVGKTELAKALAEALYGSENSLIRLDMSEYCEAHSVSRLIGSPPGYIGYDDGGQLTEKVRRNPHHIILFDEIEKAHRDVFDLLLQIMDEGVLCDSRGRKISFKNTVIIMTSNVGASGKNPSSNPLGFVAKDSDENAYAADRLREVFSSEFLSRPDEIIVFKSLNRATILKISENMLKKLEDRILSNENITVRFERSVAQYIADSVKCENGARDVRRAILSSVEGPLSLFILKNSVSSGQAISVLFENGNIIFEKQDKNPN